MDLLTSTPVARVQVATSLEATASGRTLRWLWACRALDQASTYRMVPAGRVPRAGDVIVAEVTRIRNHTRIMTAANERLHLYEGDLLVGVLGNRYATDAFEAEVTTTDDLHILTAAGMMGTVRSRHAGVKAPTELRFVGHLSQDGLTPLNLTQVMRHPPRPFVPASPILFVVGTGMNSGKTTTTAKLVKGLLNQGLRVAACKLTGSVSHRDQYAMRGTGAHHVRDFSDYGYPSTYLCNRDGLTELFDAMMADAAATVPDVTVVEIADGVLQRETMLLLEDDYVKQRIHGVVLTASCALSALRGVEEIERRGHQVVMVSGLITNAPLFVREFDAHRPDVTVASSTDDGTMLATTLRTHLQTYLEAA